MIGADKKTLVKNQLALTFRAFQIQDTGFTGHVKHLNNIHKRKMFQVTIKRHVSPRYELTSQKTLHYTEIWSVVEQIYCLTGKSMG
jgi:hypothetical protein